MDYSPEDLQQIDRDEKNSAFERQIQNIASKDNGFVWRSRVLIAMYKKMRALPTHEERIKLYKNKIAHLQKWCDNYLSDIKYNETDKAEYARDIYAYHGVRRSDFYNHNRNLTLV